MELALRGFRGTWVTNSGSSAVKNAASLVYITRAIICTNHLSRGQMGERPTEPPIRLPLEWGHYLDHQEQGWGELWVLGLRVCDSCFHLPGGHPIARGSDPSQTSAHLTAKSPWKNHELYQTGSDPDLVMQIPSPHTIYFPWAVSQPRQPSLPTIPDILFQGGHWQMGVWSAGWHVWWALWNQVTLREICRIFFKLWNLNCFMVWLCIRDIQLNLFV